MINTAKQHILLPIIEAGYSAVLAGGTPRDNLFNCNIHDCDVATTAPEELIRSLFPGCIDVSKNMNLKVFVVKINNYRFEIARFRCNEKYNNHRQPEHVDFNCELMEDAARRDFTMNAMYIDASGELIDLVGGQEDISNKLLRCVGDPNVRFDEDVLRILRGIRFAVKFDLEIEENTRRAMFNNCQYLATLPPERITDEFHKIMALGGSKFSRALKIMRDTGVLGVLLPEVACLKDFWHDLRWHPEAEGNVLGHCLEAVRVCKSTDPEMLWAVLLHDVGKAVTYKLREKPNGELRKTFYEHDIAGVPIIEQIATRLCLPNRTRDIAKYCAEKHMLVHRMFEMKAAKVLALVQHPYFEYLMEVGNCDANCRGEHEESKEELKKRFEFIKRFKETTEMYTSIVTGKYIMETCEIESGPKVGILIAKLKEWIANKNITDADAIKNKVLEFNRMIKDGEK